MSRDVQAPAQSEASRKPTRLRSVSHTYEGHVATTIRDAAKHARAVKATGAMVIILEPGGRYHTHSCCTSTTMLAGALVRALLDVSLVRSP